MTSQFLGTLKTEEHPDGRHAWLLSPLCYYSAKLGFRLYVPGGFWTDFASHPLLTVRNRGNRGAVLHDWLYEFRVVPCHDMTAVEFGYYVDAHLRGEVAISVGHVRDVSKWEADLIYLEANVASEFPLWRSSLYYIAVTLGGWKPWLEKDRGNMRPFTWQTNQST